MSKQAAGKRIRLPGPASIQAMQLTFNQRTRVRFPGGVPSAVSAMESAAPF